MFSLNKIKEKVEKGCLKKEKKIWLMMLFHGAPLFPPLKLNCELSFPIDEASEDERRRNLGLPAEDPIAAKPSEPIVKEKKGIFPVKPNTKAEQMRECLRSLKKNHKDEDASIKKAFQHFLPMQACGEESSRGEVQKNQIY